MIDEPTIEESIEILKGFEATMRTSTMKYPDKVLEAAVRMSERYITDRYLPIRPSMFDEAGSRVNLRNQGLVDLEMLREELERVQELKETAAQENEYEKAAQYKVQEVKITEKIKKLRSPASWRSP